MKDSESKKFISFRKKLYKGDDLYVGTADFILDMLIKKTTRYARSCEIAPLSFESGGNREAQALFVHNPADDFASLAFFDCVENGNFAAQCVIKRAKELCAARGIKRLVAGLNAHLSYGVGILTAASLKNSFDTCYNKSYYAEFFKDFPVANALTAYRNGLREVRGRLKDIEIDIRGYTVRHADFKRFEDECETMRMLCDSTIGQTYLYAKTAERHFYELLKDMKILLRGNNLLFLMYGGKEVGFLFWHPDYNGAVKAGKSVGAPSFAVQYLLRGKKIDTVKLNSIGVTDAHRGKGTLALLRAMDAEIGDRYEFLETNFVWDRNKKSSLLNRRLIGGECRKFAVYETGI